MWTGAGPSAHLFDAASQGFVDQLPERGMLCLLQSLQGRSDIVVKRQGRSHASEHKESDALMPTRSRMERTATLLLGRHPRVQSLRDFNLLGTVQSGTHLGLNAISVRANLPVGMESVDMLRLGYRARPSHDRSSRRSRSGETTKRSQTRASIQGDDLFGFVKESQMRCGEGPNAARNRRESRRGASAARKMKFANQSQFVEGNQRAENRQSQSEANSRCRSQSLAPSGRRVRADALSCGP